MAYRFRDDNRPVAAEVVGVRETRNKEDNGAVEFSVRYDVTEIESAQKESSSSRIEGAAVAAVLRTERWVTRSALRRAPQTSEEIAAEEKEVSRLHDFVSVELFVAWC